MTEDITEQVEALQLLEQRVQERTREIERRREVAEGLRNILIVLNSKRPLNEILKHIIVQACHLLEAERCTIFRFEAATQLLHLEAMQGFSSDILGLETGSLDVGVTRRAALARAPVLISDIAKEALREGLGVDPRTGEQWDRLRGIAHALHAVPLMVRGELYGVLTLYYLEPRAFTDEERDLAVTIAEQAALAIENARLSEQARQLAILAERQRLARELHDSVSQSLYGIALETHTALNRMMNDPQRAVEPLESVLSLTAAALEEMRAAIFELRPESLETEGLVTALRHQAEYLHTRHGIQVQTLLGTEPEVLLDVKEALYRIAQEALQNIIKHAHATQVEMQLHRFDSGLVLEIGDNGTGFDTAQSFPGHLGLHSMRERTAQLGGMFEMESGPYLGTHIRVEIPL